MLTLSSLVWSDGHAAVGGNGARTRQKRRARKSGVMGVHRGGNLLVKVALYDGVMFMGGNGGILSRRL
jgi:hypothetical protein